jgi:putative hydrolase of the HAD superfamily
MTLTPNLLFDLGGVIMDIDRMRCVRAFEALGMSGANDFLGEYCQKGPFLMLESGEVTPAEFRAEVRRHIAAEVSDEQIDEAFCQFLIGIPEERLDALRELRRRGHRVWMLSNTNAIMWHRRIIPEFTKQGLDLSAYFDGVVTSFDAKVCKPDARIYQLVLSRFGITAESTTFFDDGAVNVEAARRLGFHAEQITPEHSLLSIL